MLCYVRWLLRSRARFGHRVVVLIDSRVVIGAVAKGRSSSTPLNALLRRLAALCFAGGLVLHCVFVPTSHNPSDWPSRGGPGTWPSELRRNRPKPCAPVRVSRISARLAELERDRQRALQMLDSVYGEWLTSSSSGTTTASARSSSTSSSTSSSSTASSGSTISSC